MIRDDQVHIALFRVVRSFEACDTTIYRDDQLVLLDGLLQRGGGQAIAIFQTMRQKGIYASTDRPQNGDQQGGAGNAIHVVVAVHENRLVALHCLPNSGCGSSRAGEQIGVAKILESWVQKRRDRLVRHVAIRKHQCGGARHLKLTHDGVNRVVVRPGYVPLQSFSVRHPGVSRRRRTPGTPYRHPQSSDYPDLAPVCLIPCRANHDLAVTR